MGLPDPWTELRSRQGLLLIRAPIRERGRYYHHLRTIVVRDDLLVVEERATLWHELVHADRGDQHCHTWGNRQERWCIREAARRAIPLQALADALIWSDHPREIADELKTTTELLEARRDHLHPAERGYITRRRAAREDAA